MEVKFNERSETDVAVLHSCSAHNILSEAFFTSLRVEKENLPTAVRGMIGMCHLDVEFPRGLKLAQLPFLITSTPRSGAAVQVLGTDTMRRFKKVMFCMGGEYKALSYVMDSDTTIPHVSVTLNDAGEVFHKIPLDTGTSSTRIDLEQAESRNISIIPLKQPKVKHRRNGEMTKVTHYCTCELGILGEQYRVNMHIVNDDKSRGEPITIGRDFLQKFDRLEFDFSTETNFEQLDGVLKIANNLETVF